MHDFLEVLQSEQGHQGNEVGNYMKDGSITECGEEGDYWSDWDEKHKVPRQ